MEPNQMTQPKANLKDIFLNLGGFVALYTVLYSVVNLLFTVINVAYPQVTSYGYYGSQSISFPVATLVIFFPIFVYLMWLIQRGFATDPEKRGNKVHKWLTYITLFISGLTLAGDLVTVIYYFIDGQELTTAFLMKFLVVFVIALGLFLYFISDIREKLTLASEKMWIILATLVVVGSIVWGFAVLGSPRTQQLYKYDDQKVSDLQQMNNAVTNYYANKGALPNSLVSMTNSGGYYYFTATDGQTGKPYEYKKTGEVTYNVCADFNKASRESNGRGDMYTYPYGPTWKHPAGYFCFVETVEKNLYRPPVVPVAVPY